MAIVNMNEYPPNTDEYRERKETPQLEQKEPPKPVAQGTIVEEKKTIGKSLRRTFIQDDVKSVRNWFIDQIIIPRTQKILSDIIDSFAIGIKAYFKVGNQSPPNSYTSYNQYSSYTNNGYTNYTTYNRPTTYNANMNRSYTSPKCIFFDSDLDIQRVLDEFAMIIQKDGYINQITAFSICGCNTSDASNHYGWRDIRCFHYEPAPDRRGFYLTMDAPVYIS